MIVINFFLHSFREFSWSFAAANVIQKADGRWSPDKAKDGYIEGSEKALKKGIT